MLTLPFSPLACDRSLPALRRCRCPTPLRRAIMALSAVAVCILCCRLPSPLRHAITVLKRCHCIHCMHLLPLPFSTPARHQRLRALPSDFRPCRCMLLPLLSQLRHAVRVSQRCRCTFLPPLPFPTPACHQCLRAPHFLMLPRSVASL